MSLFPPIWGAVPERTIFDMATPLVVPDAPVGRQESLVQRKKSRSEIRAHQGQALLEAEDKDGLTEQGGAVIVSRHWALSVAHCGAKIIDGAPVAFWKKLILSPHCEDRDIKTHRFGIREIWVHRRYMSYRGGFANDIMALYSPEPFPEQFIMKPRALPHYEQDIGERVSIRNMGAAGKAGTAIDGDLQQYLEDDIMEVSGVNPIYHDLRPVDGNVGRPGASGNAAFDADGPDAGAFAGLVSHTDAMRTMTTLMPPLDCLRFLYEIKERRNVARQLGQLTSMAA